MIAQLRGKIVEKTPTSLVVDCAGVGYAVHVSVNTSSAITGDGEVIMYTQMIVREDAQLLYGFHDKEERIMFNHLISVSGIGPSTAILMLSALSPSEVARAIQSEDVVTIKGVKGIGAKTAERVIVDLRDKVGKLSFSENNLASKGNTNRFEALSALVSLGFDKKSVDKALDKINNDELTVEELIRHGLKIL
jgi:Holliday junction DNA helicase RuvA